MEAEGENDVSIQITCRFSSDNLNNRFDLNINHPEQKQQFVYTEKDGVDKIFHDTVEDLNLTKFYLDGYDVTIVKNGTRNIFYEQQYDANSTLKTDKSSSLTDSSTSNEGDSDENESDDEENENSSDGLVHSFIRTVFEDLVSKDVHYLFSVGWTEISDHHNQLIDLLNGNGLVQCFAMPQLLETIAVGLKNKNEMNNHNILSIVLEQQWIDNVNGQPMHKVSTVNFCDFKYANDKVLPSYQPAAPEPNNFYQMQSYLPPYMFSPPPQIPPNSFFAPPMMIPPTSPDSMFFGGTNNPFRNNFFDNANSLLVQQNQKLLKNAELLFSKLNINDIDEDRKKEIQEWMYLKNECDNYMSSSTIADLPPPPPSYIHSFANQPMPMPAPPQPQQQSSLLPIIEMDENSTGRDEDETNDSESASYIDINDQSNNLFQKISDKVVSFQEKTDELVRDKCKEYFENNPKVIVSSGSDCKPPPPRALSPVALSYDNLIDEASGGAADNNGNNDLTKSSTTSEQYLATTGRRRSIRDNNILNSDELNSIRKAAAATSFDLDSVKGAENENHNKLDELKKSLKKSLASIDATGLQIKEVEQTIALKKNLITDLIENNKTRVTAKNKCSKKKSKIQNEYEKCKKDLSKAILVGKNALEVQRLKEMATKFEEKLLDLTGINEIATESSSNKKVKQLHKSLEQSKKQLEVLNKVLKKDVKAKDNIEKEITKYMKTIEENECEESQKKVLNSLPSPSSATTSKVNDNKFKIRDVNARISHLDEILKEKSSNLKVCGDSGEDKEKESLRYEIRNLRRTRDTLLDQRVGLYKKLKRDKMLSYKEERKMLECDEAIEAIDDVIEVKNELICGHKSIDTNEKLEREKGEQLLMGRLNKLSEEEMRILLYKYFMKVIDLKETCRKLEHNVMTLEHDKEAWEWREKILTNAIRQARLESERNLIIQQKNHETRLNLLLRHFANDTAHSSLTESNFDASTSTSGTPLPDYEQLNIVKATKSASSRHHHQQYHHQQTEIGRDFKKNLFTKFHVFTRYQQGSSGMTGENENERAVGVMIPHENLKQLTGKKPVTKVTRQKNKLIIQQNDKT
jgi:costal 2